MSETTYRDLAEFGVPFIMKTDEAFYPLVEQMTGSKLWFGEWPETLPERAAVLCNNSGKHLVALAWVWYYMDPEGQTTWGCTGNFGSSAQLDLLTGKGFTGHMHSSFIAPGSKRLVTEEGVFGDNFDVVPFPEHPMGRGFGMGRSSRQQERPAVSVELVLDFVVFDDGLFAGPDAFGTFDSMTAGIVQVQATAAESHRLLLEGASEGQIFDRLLPFVRASRMPPAPSGHREFLGPMGVFAQMSVGQLSHSPREQLLDWFFDYAKPPAIRLHRHTDRFRLKQDTEEFF